MATAITQITTGVLGGAGTTGLASNVANGAALGAAFGVVIASLIALAALAIVAALLGGAGGFTGRRRRSTDEDDDMTERMLKVVAKLDTYGCGLRTVCHIYGQEEDELSSREVAIKDLIGNASKPLLLKRNKKKGAEAHEQYQSAAEFGGNGKDCNRLYQKCPLIHAQVREYLNNLQLPKLGA